jgi:small-conductance mechanosensitive channel/CRP-like cAMP-binding protein
MLLLRVIGALILLALRVWGEAGIRPWVPKPYDAFVLAAVSFLLTLALAAILDWLIRRLYWRSHFQARRGHEAPALMRDLGTVFLFALALSIWLYWELDVSAAGLMAASGATAVVIGLALQTMILDFFSGLSISLDGSYGIGEWLTLHGNELGGSVYGRVEGITWRSTLLRLEDGRCILIPNRLATSNPLTNHSRPAAPKRYEVEIAIDNRVPSERALRLLAGEAFKAVQAPGLSADPLPSVVMTKLTNDEAVYCVRFYARPDRIGPNEACSVMLTALHAGIERLAVPMAVQQVEICAPPAAAENPAVRDVLRHIPLFGAVLSDAQREELAAACETCRIEEGATLMTQGEPASSMFVILEGAAAITVSPASGEAPRPLAVLASGDIVGEMSLMTGAPRSATVSALTPLRVLEITKPRVEALLAASPELVEGFGRMLAQRQSQLQELSSRNVAWTNVERDLVARMRTFFARAFSPTERREANKV